MQSSLSESVQQQCRPGKCVDIYYPDPQTSEKACYRTTQNTRYVQAFTNLSGGTSTYQIPPANGIQDIVVIFELPKLTGATDGIALNRGWGYSAIKQISFRYGGSSTYFLSGQQVLQNALRQAPNSGARDDILTLGGDAVTGTQMNNAPSRAYVWLSLPHCIPTAEGKLPPIPSDLLTQQIIVQVELYSIKDLYSIAPGSNQVAPSELNMAEFQVQQVMLENQGDALARRVDMTTHSLSVPVNFVQQAVQIPLGAGTTNKNLTLTGFRSGEVKSIQVWVTKASDTTSAVKNPFAWYEIADLTLTYAGEIFARFDKGSGQLWNLVNGRMTPAVNNVRLIDGGNGTISITNPRLDHWLELPFAQSYDTTTAHSMYTSGREITNGIVNLSFSLADSVPSADDYVLNVSYCYNSVLLFSQGTCSYLL